MHCGQNKKRRIEDKKQYARFVETAERIKKDNPEEAFEEAFQKIIRVKRVKKNRRQKS